MVTDWLMEKARLREKAKLMVTDWLKLTLKHFGMLTQKKKQTLTHSEIGWQMVTDWHLQMHSLHQQKS